MEKTAESSKPISIDPSLVLEEAISGAPSEKLYKGAKIVGLIKKDVNGVIIPKFILERTESGKVSQIELIADQEDINKFEEILKEKI